MYIGLKIGDLHSLAERLLLNYHTSVGRLGSTASVGSQFDRKTTPIRNPRVPGVLDSLDV